MLAAILPWHAVAHKLSKENCDKIDKSTKWNSKFWLTRRRFWSYICVADCMVVFVLPYKCIINREGYICSLNENYVKEKKLELNSNTHVISGLELNFPYLPVFAAFRWWILLLPAIHFPQIKHRVFRPAVSLFSCHVFGRATFLSTAIPDLCSCDTPCLLHSDKISRFLPYSITKNWVPLE